MLFLAWSQKTALVSTNLIKAALFMRAKPNVSSDTALVPGVHGSSWSFMGLGCGSLEQSTLLVPAFSKHGSSESTDVCSFTGLCLVGFSVNLELSISSSHQCSSPLGWSYGILGKISVTLALFPFAWAGSLSGFGFGLKLPRLCCIFVYSIGLCWTCLLVEAQELPFLFVLWADQIVRKPLRGPWEIL